MHTTTISSPVSATFEAPQVRNILSVAVGNEPFFEDGFGSTTYGRLGFRRLESDQASDAVTLDPSLELRLSLLCDKLRAKY